MGPQACPDDDDDGDGAAKSVADLAGQGRHKQGVPETGLGRGDNELVWGGSVNWGNDEVLLVILEEIEMCLRAVFNSSNLNGEFRRKSGDSIINGPKLGTIEFKLNLGKIVLFNILLEVLTLGIFVVVLAHGVCFVGYCDVFCCMEKSLCCFWTFWDLRVKLSLFSLLAFFDE